LPFGDLLEEKNKIEYQHCVGSPNVAVGGSNDSFSSEFSSNFDLKNMILNYSKIFKGQKWPKLARF